MKKQFFIILVVMGFLQPVKSQCPPSAIAFFNADPHCAQGCAVLLAKWPEGVTVYIFGGSPIAQVTQATISGTYGGPGLGSAYICVPCNISLFFASTVPGANNGCVIIGGFTTPLKLTNFSLQIIDNSSCNLKWRTYSENPGTSFTIQRSSNSRDFKDIFTLSGNGKNINDYSYTDKSIEPGTQFFRIKITEAGGKMSYSEIALIKNQSNFGASLYPNPAENEFKITIPARFLPATVLIYNAEGRAIYTMSTLQPTVLVNSRFAKGIYAVRITGNNNISITQTLMVK